MKGPFSAMSRTLPANFDLHFESTGDATCDIIDPCAWSPKLPLWYELHASFETAQGAKQMNQTIALRDCRIVGDRCYAAGERKVFRIVAGEAVSAFEWSQWRESRTTVFTKGFTSAILAESLREGVYLVIQADGQMTSHTWRQVRSCASVLGVVLTADLHEEFTGVSCWKMFRAHTAGCLQKDYSWADAVWVDESLLPIAREAIGDSLPIFVFDEVGRESPGDLSAFRSQCDALQRRTASITQCAGYAVVTQE